jgi:uncharacterized membrane protein (UPF0127 family)
MSGTVTRGAAGMARGLILAALTGAVLVANGCGPTSEDDRVSVRLGDAAWTVLLAGPDGMRSLPGFDGADGMLFDLERDVAPGSVVFVMDDVTIPLDIAWFSAEGDLVGTSSMVPCPAVPCPTYAPDVPFRWAIEAPPGAFDDMASSDRLVVDGPSP